MIKELIGKRILESRKILGLTQTQVGQRIGVSKEYISMLENGQRIPNLEILYKLAKFFHQDINYFLSHKEPTFSILLRREELNKEGKTDLLKFKKFCDNYIFIEEITKKELRLAPNLDSRYPLKKLRSFESKLTSAEKLAEEERSRLKIGNEPIKGSIFSLMEIQGCHVVILPINEKSNIDGAFIFDENKAFVLINGSQPKERQVFTAAHEYCHYLKDRNYKFWIDTPEVLSEENIDSRKPLETFANFFAAHFLMPKNKIKELIEEDLGERLGPEDIIYLKRYFGVSYQAILYHLKNLDYLSKARLNDFLKMKPSVLEEHFFQDSRKEKGKRQLYIPERFFSLALEAYLSNKISIGRLSELLYIDVISLKDILSKAKFLRSKKIH